LERALGHTTDQLDEWDLQSKTNSPTTSAINSSTSRPDWWRAITI
jgi:hypothetical protein